MSVSSKIFLAARHITYRSFQVLTAREGQSRFNNSKHYAAAAVTNLRLSGGPSNDPLFDFSRFPGAVDLAAQVHRRRMDRLARAGVTDVESALHQLASAEVAGETRPWTVSGLW